ncbi:MAG: dienelactone hydrolase family protein, partial [Vicinamibacteria bacterium]
VYQTRFDITLLSERMIGTAEWALAEPSTRSFPLGFFGASTGAAAALRAAAKLGPDVFAVVSRGGRPDLTGPVIADVRSPTLLIVGGRDTTVLGMNRQAYAQLRVEKELAVVPGATHLFEEPGALEEVTRLAADWFVRHLS